MPQSFVSIESMLSLYHDALTVVAVIVVDFSFRSSSRLFVFDNPVNKAVKVKHTTSNDQGKDHYDKQNRLYSLIRRYLCHLNSRV